MKHYIVKVLAINGRKNKIYRSGDKVNEDCFPPGNAEKLRADGYLELIDEDKKAPADFDSEAQPEFIPAKEVTIDDVKVPEMKEALKDANIEVPKNATKTELFGLWKKLTGK